MREVNFSIPNANKASVGITTALYDRRALDCTSTLPLINSLNNLACLTTSSARIRDILTVDGGIERLVCILKEGRNKDMMEIWKWNLAFQCIVNIGVRGSEAVRTRVVEADIVPVIATILDNYIKVMDKVTERTQGEMGRGHYRYGSSGRHSSRHNNGDRSGQTHSSRSERASRRNVPPPIDIPASIYTPPSSEASVTSTAAAAAAHVRGSSLPTVPLINSNNSTTTSTTSSTTTNSTTAASTTDRSNLFSRSTGSHSRHQHHRSHDRSNPLFAGLEGIARPSLGHQLATTALLGESPETFGLRPVREVDRLPSMLPLPVDDNSSQPVSPRTPNAIDPAILNRRHNANAAHPRDRPPLRHQLSMSGESDAEQNDEAASDEAGTADAVNEPIVGIQNEVSMQDLVDQEDLMEAGATPVPLADNNPSDGPDGQTFNITHRSAIDGSLLESTTPTPANQTAPLYSPAQPNAATLNAPPPSLHVNWFPSRMGMDRAMAAGVIAACPREEDVLLSLQLLAYVSKYCNLRSYFQQSHLVPRLQIGEDIALLDGEAPAPLSAEARKDTADEDWDAEYLLENDFNIFPLVERYTMRMHSADMKYWAGVVMRNLCRKDDARGGIRQCAWYKCGKWEEFTRQFAKCRRCRRTKYCSKDCQKSAWVYHRHWCTAATQDDSVSGSGHPVVTPATTATGSNSGHGHGHSHSHGHGHGHGHHGARHGAHHSTAS